MTFTVEIETGSETTAPDVAVMLEVTAARVRNGWPGEDIPAYPGASGPVRDRNGNTVGRWDWSA